MSLIKHDLERYETDLYWTEQGRRRCKEAEKSAYNMRIAALNAVIAAMNVYYDIIQEYPVKPLEG